MARALVIVGALGVLVLVGWSLMNDGILGTLIRSDLSAAERVDVLRDYFLSWGVFAPIIYVLVVTVEVIVAPIPGLMLYAPGGVVFGGFYGGLLSLIGNVLGAGIAAASMQVFFGEKSRQWLERDKVEAIASKLRESGIWVILALRINPLTTSDLVSYAAGLAGVPTWKVMVGTGIGMAPLCWAQAYLAGELFEAAPWLLYPLLALLLGYVVVAVVLIRRALSSGS